MGRNQGSLDSQDHRQSHVWRATWRECPGSYWTELHGHARQRTRLSALPQPLAWVPCSLLLLAPESKFKRGRLSVRPKVRALTLAAMGQGRTSLWKFKFSNWNNPVSHKDSRINVVSTHWKRVQRLSSLKTTIVQHTMPGLLVTTFLPANPVQSLGLPDLGLHNLVILNTLCSFRPLSRCIYSSSTFSPACYLHKLPDADITSTYLRSYLWPLQAGLAAFLWVPMAVSICLPIPLHTLSWNHVMKDLA